MSFDFRERIQTISPTTAKVSDQGGECQRTYSIEIASAAELFSAYKQILGYTKYNPSSDGALKRTPPFADPTWTMMFANSIPNIKGVGKMTKTESNPEIEVPTIGDFALYPTYDFTVNFSSRQYNVQTDDNIQILSGSWTKEDGTTVQSYQYPNEWLRYTTCYPVKPDGSYLTQQGSTLAGSMEFIGGAADGKTCAFQPSVRVPNYYVSLLWKAVPLRYITSSNSYIMNKGWQNRVNQNAIQLPFNGPGDSCAPGSLLYIDYSYQAYTPLTGFEWDVYSNGDASQKLVDITLNFLWTTRTISTAITAPTNHNYIAGGHNLLYWHGNLECQYSEVVLRNSSGVKTSSRPTYLSAPLELLQCDPDYVQTGGIVG